MGACGARARLLQRDRRGESGKLKAAARALVGSSGGTDEAAQDAQLFGFPEELIQAVAQAGQEQGEFGVWRENWDTVCAFAAVVSQWRAAPLARGGLHFIGLDYTAARAGLDAEEIPVTPTLWRGLREMEAAARDVLNMGT